MTRRPWHGKSCPEERANIFWTAWISSISSSLKVRPVWCCVIFDVGSWIIKFLYLSPLSQTAQSVLQESSSDANTVLYIKQAHNVCCIPEVLCNLFFFAPSAFASADYCITCINHFPWFTDLCSASHVAECLTISYCQSAQITPSSTTGLWQLYNDAE